MGKLSTPRRMQRETIAETPKTVGKIMVEPIGKTSNRDPLGELARICAIIEGSQILQKNLGHKRL